MLLADDDSKTKKVAFAAVDTLLWQALASVIIPGFTINRICAASLYTMGRAIPNVSFVHLFFPRFISSDSNIESRTS